MRKISDIGRHSTVFILNGLLSYSPFCLIWVLPLQFSFDFHLHGILFPSPHFQSVCVSSSKVTVCVQSCFCMHSLSLYLLLGVFKLFIFKVTIDMYILIAIWSVVLFLWVFFLLSSFILSDLMTLLCYVWIPPPFLCEYLL